MGSHAVTVNLKLPSLGGVRWSRKNVGFITQKSEVLGSWVEDHSSLGWIWTNPTDRKHAVSHKFVEAKWMKHQQIISNLPVV